MNAIFSNKDIRRFFITLGLFMLAFLLLGQVVASSLTKSTRSMLYTRDTELAGALLESGMTPGQAAALLTGASSPEKSEAGKEVLSQAGYTLDTPINYLPLLSAFKRSSALSLLACCLLSALCTAGICLLYFKRQQKTIELARLELLRFMNGNTDARLESDVDGSLYHFFASVNALATSLTSHLTNEKKSRDFLKDTLSDISHQLKTPLAALKMYNEILSEDGTDPQVLSRFTAKTSDSLNRMETLIQNLLKITRLDAGAITLRPSLTPIQSMMTGIRRSFEVRAEFEGKSLNFTGDPEILLFYDPDWLPEAVSNLVKNALDHTSSGGCVTVNWDTSAAVTRIMVQDDGSGIHPEDIHHIFKRFYRSRFSQDTQGAGLGLSLAKAIACAHGGTIAVESRPGQGALFTLTFLKMTKL